MINRRKAVSRRICAAIDAFASQGIGCCTAAGTRAELALHRRSAQTSTALMQVQGDRRMRSTCRVPEQEHENSTRKVPDRAPSMLACWDRGLRCRFANKAYERWFEVAADTLNGTAIQDLLEPTLFALDEPLKTAKCTGS